jgi:hypothetical protein
MALNQNQKISFIPKKSLVKGGDGERRPLSLLLFASLLMLILVWGVYGGFYLYARSVQTSITEKQNQLKAFNDQFDRPLITQAQML